MKKKCKNQQKIIKTTKMLQKEEEKNKQLLHKEEEKNKQMLHKKVFEKAHRAASHFKSEVRIRTAMAITTAFALVIALAWQDVIKQTITRILDGMQLSSSELVKMTLLYQSITAIAITGICVIGIIIATRWSNK